MNVTVTSLGAAVTLALLVACAPVSMPEPDEGQAFYAQNCASCHGANGRGNGPISGDLKPKPADLTILARGNGGTFPTARALSYIWGDPVEGHLIRVMPEFGRGMAIDLVPLEVDGVLTPTPRALAGLLGYLESIQR
ncbi:MAG: cytochrome c [Sulfitobacter sp.]